MRRNRKVTINEDILRQALREGLRDTLGKYGDKALRKYNRLGDKAKIGIASGALVGGMAGAGAIDAHDQNAEREANDEGYYTTQHMNDEHVGQNSRINYSPSNRYGIHAESRRRLSRIINESISKVLNEISNGDESDEEYDPWMNGDASWISGKYDIPYGFHVEINPSMSYVSIESRDEEGNEDEENSYFLQGDEADNLIRDIARYWSQNNCSQEEAVNTIVRGLF